MQRQTDLPVKNGSHVWWKKAKQLSKISCGKENRVIPNLEGKGVTASSDVAKAELQLSLAQYFADQCSNTSSETVGCPVHFRLITQLLSSSNLRINCSCQTVLSFRFSRIQAATKLLNRFLRNTAAFIN